MSRRKTVALKMEFVNARIKEKCRHNVVFCELMGREDQPTWVTDWNRKPKPKNLPSPEEAAKMCAILQATPEEILVEQDDIELVKIIIDRERTSQKEPATQTGDGLDDLQRQAFDLIKKIPTEQLQTVIGVLKAILGES